MIESSTLKIGFFDSGLGGATILKNAYSKINAEFIYMADNKNAPYGIKDIETVKKLTEHCIKKLINLGCNIIVIACNTATSAAIEYLRNKYLDVIFIGTEPAIKPAIEKTNNKKIILTATSLTLKGNKLSDLLKKLNAENKVTLLPLDKLVEYADKTDKICYDLAKDYLKEKFSKLDLNEYSGIVLGCTHFPIFKEQMRKILPNTIEIYDSSEGVTNNLDNIIKNKFCNEEIKKSLKVILTEESKDLENKITNLVLNSLD